MKSKVFFLLIVSFTIGLLAQNKNVTIDQRLSTGEQIGVLKKWEVSNWGNAFNPGSTLSFPLYADQVILGDQSVYSNQKCNNWNNDFSNVKNHRSFTILPTTNLLLSNFVQTHTGVTIKTSLEGTETTGGLVIFKDPWFIDYQDGQYANQLRNRGMSEAYPYPRTSPFYPNATTPFELGQTYKGVFLDQSGPGSNWAGTFYKTNVPFEQTINVHGQNRKFYFNKWEASILNNQPSAVFQDATL